ncbi:MAG: RidA family protein [Bryobacterales bacterium]|nr:RidA family protein [Bryobacterales bacterium]
MEKIEIKHPDRMVHTGSFSGGVLADGWLFVSGQAALDLTTSETLSGSIEEETRVTMDHTGKILAQAGATFDDIVKCTCHLADIRDFDGFDRAYAAYFSGVRPAHYRAIGDGSRYQGGDRRHSNS